MQLKRKHRKNINHPGHAHELTFSCYRGFKFMQAERTCVWLAEAIAEARVEWNFDVWAYVFMPEHIHLIVHPREISYDIAQIRTALKAPVARKAIGFLAESSPEWLPRIARKRGKKTERLYWQSGGGYDRNVFDSDTLLKMIDYIHLNPVRKHYVDRAIDWTWSSATWYISGVAGPIPIDPIPADWGD